MLRPIDANALYDEYLDTMKELMKSTKNENISAEAISLLCGAKLITDAKTIQPKTAKWIRLTGMAPPEYHGHKICSVCESFAPYDPLHPWREMLTHYCPGCGAEMEGETYE